MLRKFLINLSIISPILVIFPGIFEYLVTKNISGLYYSLYIIVFGFFGNWLLKTIGKVIFPHNQIFMRPKISLYDCGLYIQELNKTIRKYDDWGMPSGHAQIISIAATYYLLRIWNRKNKNIFDYFLITILVTFWLIFLSSRLYLHCHNLIQVIIGAVIGIILGIVLFILN